MPDTKRSITPLECSICGELITIEPLTGWTRGNNAFPVNAGRCCNDCNRDKVIPARFRALYAQTLKSNGRDE